MSDIPEPPGVAIHDFLELHGITVEELATQIPCSPDLMKAIVFGTEMHWGVGRNFHQITPMMAKKLVGVIGGSEVYWLDLEKKFRDYLSFCDTNAVTPKDVWHVDELG